MAADPNQAVISAFRVTNPETQELALHAVYLIDQDRSIFYRKVALRRPTSAELIDAFDAHRGVYPRLDRKPQRPPRVVAYPSNNFQVLLEMHRAAQPPTALDPAVLASFAQTFSGGPSDDGLIEFRRFVKSQPRARKPALLTASAWLTRQRYMHNNEAMRRAAADLALRLEQVTQLEQTLSESADENIKDQALHKLANARGLLSRARATVRRNASSWRLRSAQGMLRSLREVSQETAAAP